MSDDEQDRKARDNTGLEPKPDNVQQAGYAPKGHLGHQSSAPSLTPGGTAQSRQKTQKLERRSQQQSSGPGEDSRPVAVKTGDKAVDRQSEERGQKLMTMDEIKAKGKEQEQGASQKGKGPQVSQSDYAKAFQKARDKTRTMHKSKDQGHDYD